MITIRLRIDALVVLLIILSACESAPAADSRAAAANLASAQAQATITSQDATQTAAEANARLQQQYQQATQQAQAQNSAQQNEINQIMIAQAQTNATASAHQAQAAVSSAWLQVTAQAQPIQATQIAVNATATKTATEVDSEHTNAWVYQLIDIASAVLIRIGAVVLAIYFVLVAIQKIQAHNAVIQQHPGGPAFAITYPLLGSPDIAKMYDPDEWRTQQPIEMPPEQHQQIAAPAPVIKDAEMTAMFNANRLVQASIHYAQYLTAMGKNHKDKHDHGYNGWMLLTWRECQAAGLFKRPDDWEGGVKWLISKSLAYSDSRSDGMKTRQVLGDLAVTVAAAIAPYSPAAAVLDQNENGGNNGNMVTSVTSGNTPEQGVTSEKTSGNGHNTDLDAAIEALPDWTGPHVPPKPPAPKPKAGLLRRIKI